MPKGKSSLKSLLLSQQAKTAERLASAKAAEARDRKERSITGQKGKKKSQYGQEKDGGSNSERERATWGKKLEEQHRGLLPKGAVVGKGKGKGKKEVIGEESQSTPNISKSKGKQRLTYPFEPTDTILLVGEGNFSYSLSLLLPPHSHPAHLVLATAYDDEFTCYEKYPDAKEIVEKIQGLGARVAWGVDAGRLGKCKAVGKGKRWSKIVFNFPHAGAGIKDQDRNVLTNQHLLLQFFRSSAPLLTVGPSKYPEIENNTLSGGGKAKKMPRGTVRKGRGGDRSKGSDNGDDEDEDEGVSDLEDEVFEDEDEESTVIKSLQSKSTSTPTDTFLPPTIEGTLLITLKSSLPYTLWDLPHLATRPPNNQNQIPQPRYRLLRSFAFWPDLYEGYEHRRTLGWKEGVSKKGNEEILKGEGGCRTWEFALREDQYGG